MKKFFCTCGNEVFFENGHCNRCNTSLGYDYHNNEIVSLIAEGAVWRHSASGNSFRLCHNRTEYGVCNGLVASFDEHQLCPSCRLNRTIPDLSKEHNLERWRRIEQAKRRMIYSLQLMQLPLANPTHGYSHGLRFDFLEDKRTNEDVAESFVSTGHLNGVITMNILEADDVMRTQQRQMSSERYRTVLGHFRHEVGHYYYELLNEDKAQFGRVFGDPNLPYAEALKRYYQHGPLDGWQQQYITAYASSHPLEDWAECFAHYQHIANTLDTAVARGVIPSLPDNASMATQLQAWDELAVTLNELNRSMGLGDAYPFVITDAVSEKLLFMEERIQNWRKGHQSA